MDIIAKQFGGLRVEAFGWSGSVADFQADEARGTLTRLTGEATFKQKMTGVPVGGGGRQTLFDGSILWRLERKEGTWKVAEVVSTPKAQ